jgi:hypothetical protein
MSIITDIGAALEMFALPQKSENRHVVTTQYLYPSNGHVNVLVMPGLAGNLTVSDGGGAIDSLTAHGLDAGDHRRVFSPVRKYKGLTTEAGEIRATRLPQNSDLLGTAIITVARAAAEVAEHGMKTLRRRKVRNLEDELLRVLQRYVGPSRLRRHEKMIGVSNRQYTFDFAIPQGRKGLLIIDAVEPEAASLQAKFTAHMDISRTNGRKIEQRIVFDEQREWKTEDLNLLAMAATLVPLSKFRAEAKAWN